MNSPSYKLVVFTEAKGHLKSIEIVPSEWIYFDEVRDKLFTYYPPNKFNNKDLWKQIDTMIKECKPAQKSWPVYEVNIHGTADSYDEAENKLNKLTKIDYVFATDPEVSAKERSLIEKKKYKFHTPTKNPNKIQELFDNAQYNLKNQKNSLSNNHDEAKGTLKELTISCYNCLSRKIDRLKGQLIEIKSEIIYLKTTAKISRMEDFVDLDYDEEVDGFKLPCESLVALRAFDEKLKEDREYKKKIYIKIRSSINKDRSIARNLGETIRQFITQDVGNRLTTFKKVPGKEVFSQFALYTCLYAIYSSIFGHNTEPLSKKTFENAIKGVINNTADWAGGRSKRQKITEQLENVQDN